MGEEKEKRLSGNSRNFSSNRWVSLLFIINRLCVPYCASLLKPTNTVYVILFCWMSSCILRIAVAAFVSGWCSYCCVEGHRTHEGPHTCVKCLHRQKKVLFSSRYSCNNDDHHPTTISTRSMLAVLQRVKLLPLKKANLKNKEST